MRGPDFFIVGAPKAGTSALHRYLSAHPKIFMPEVKEPHFFNTDLRGYYYVRDRETYLRLFSGAQPQHERLGEASVWYLYSREAARNIAAATPDARLVVMLRQPVEMFLSLHNQLLSNQIEDEPDAERAWRLQAERAEGRSIPRLCEDPKVLLYRETCRLGEQVERLLAHFPPAQIHTALFDDLETDPRGVYEAVLAFLSLPSDGRSAFPIVHPAHRPRWSRLAELHRRGDRALRTGLARGLRPLLLPLRPAMRWLARANVETTRKSPIRDGFRRELLETFAPDIDRLAAATGHDLSAWKRAPTPQPGG
jgi:hypothetical protein